MRVAVSRRGAWLIVLASVIAIAISLYDYVTPATGIDGSEGVMLVIGAQVLMLLASLAWAVVARPACWLVGFFIVSILLDILGTGACAWFLESAVLMAAMVAALIGWLMQVMTPRIEV